MVGNGGYCDGTLVVVSSHVTGQDGLKTVVSSERRSPNTSRCLAVGLADAIGEVIRERVERERVRGPRMRDDNDWLAVRRARHQHYGKMRAIDGQKISHTGGRMLYVVDLLFIIMDCRVRGLP